MQWFIFKLQHGTKVIKKINILFFRYFLLNIESGHWSFLKINSQLSATKWIDCRSFKVGNSPWNHKTQFNYIRSRRQESETDFFAQIDLNIVRNEWLLILKAKLYILSKLFIWLNQLSLALLLTPYTLFALQNIPFSLV